MFLPQPFSVSSYPSFSLPCFPLFYFYSYSQTTEKGIITEDIYPPPVDVHAFQQFINTLPDSTAERMTPALIGDRPNTYTFTKALAEAMVRSSANLFLLLFLLSMNKRSRKTKSKEQRIQYPAL